MTGRNWIAAAILAAATLVPQHADADYWRYETETGGVAFTDNPKGIPAKYQGIAQAIEEASLFGYGRLSLVDPVAIAAPTRAAEARSDSPVQYFAWPVPESIASGRDARPSSRVTLNVGGMQVEVDREGDDDEPLWVDRRQYTDQNGDYIDHNGIMSPTTIIRRGDTPIAYIDER